MISGFGTARSLRTKFSRYTMLNSLFRAAQICRHATLAQKPMKTMEVVFTRFSVMTVKMEEPHVEKEQLGMRIFRLAWFPNFAKKIWTETVSSELAT